MSQAVTTGNLREAREAFRSRDGSSRYAAVACGVLLLLPFALLLWTGDLDPAPRFIDDNQIFALDRLFEEHGVAWVVRDHFGERLLGMKRLVPVYLAHKLFEVYVLGTDLTAWSLYTAFIGSLTALALFAFGRLMRLSVFEAFAFSLIVVLGEQSVLWWRYLHGEGIGLLLTALALACVPMSVRKPSREQRYRVLFVVLCVLASLCKESFVLLLPALAFAWLLAHWRARGGGVLELLRNHAAMISVLAAVCVLELVLIRFVLGRTYFYYTGWSGFDAERFAATTREFFSPHRSSILFVFVAAAGLYLARARRPGGNWKFDATGATGLGLLVLAAAIVVPQLLLYMSSGFSGLESINFNRYLVPATFSLAVLAVFPLQWLRTTAPASRSARAARWIGVVGVAIYLVLRLVTAVHAAERFSHATEDIGRYFSAIKHHVDPEEPVLVVVGKHNLHDNVRRVAVLLVEYLELEEVYYLALTGGEPATSFEWEWSETNEYTDQIEASTVFEVDGLEPAAILIPFDNYIRLELLFLMENQDWFDPSAYARVANDNGDVAYFKTGMLPRGVRNYEDLLALVVARGTRDESGRAIITGYIQSPQYVERLILTVDGRPVESELYVEHRRMAHVELPDYAMDRADFTIVADVPAAGTVAIEAYIGDKLLRRQEIIIQE